MKICSLGCVKSDLTVLYESRIQEYITMLQMYRLPSWSRGQMHNQKCHLQTGLYHLHRELHQRDKEMRDSWSTGEQP